MSRSDRHHGAKQALRTLLLALLSSSATLGSSSISNSITVASCRAACLHVFTSSREDRDSKCRKNSDCFMCWNSCGILRHQMEAWTTMCTDHTVCFPGCQIACGFYMDGPTHKETSFPPPDTPPAPLPAYLPPPRLNRRGEIVWAALEWPGGGAPLPRNDVIFVLLKETSAGGWSEVLQTSATTAKLPDEPDLSLTRLRLLAVTEQGLVAMSETQPESESQRRRGQSYGYDAEAVRAEPPLALPNRDIVGSNPPRKGENGPASPHGNTHEFLSDASTAYTHEYPNQATEIVSLDPTWTINVIEVRLGPLAEVSVGWSPRGSGNVEYLLSWVEETGSISGHLLTDQLKSELSLWPGQGYFVQVELIDSQGNPVLRSLATPVKFTKATVVADESPDEVDIRRLTSTSIPRLINSSPSEFRAMESSTTSMEISTDVSTDPVDDLFSKEEETYLHRHVELLNNHQNMTVEDKDEYISQILQERTYEIVDTHSSHNPAQGEDGLPEVSAKEIQTEDATDRVSEILIWCAGVGIGMLLILTLCSMVIWLLGRCRRGPRNDECLEDGLSSFRGSLRLGAEKQNQRNPTTSWTFENFCSTERKPNLMPHRKESLPSGIDNASLVENYVKMLNSPSGGSSKGHH